MPHHPPCARGLIGHRNGTARWIVP